MKKQKKAKNIGIEAKPPSKSCASETCPWHGSLRVRGRIFIGKVFSSKSPKTAVVGWDFYQYISKYQRNMRKRTKISAHNPDCIDAKQGDEVVIAECRPISKTKRFVIVEKTGV